LLKEAYPPPVAFSMPIQQVHFAVSPQYGHTQLQSSIKFPQFMQRGRFSSVISFASAIFMLQSIRIKFFGKNYLLLKNL